MPQIISIHSFRGGTGKSNTAANLAAMLANQGNRVCVIDTDIQSPGIHILFGLDGEEVKSSLNDFLWHGRAIEEVALDVTPDDVRANSGTIFLVPSSIKPGEITRVLREGYDARQLTEGLRRLLTGLRLDYLLIDTHPGLNEETLLSLVISNTLLIVMRPDQQDYEGTGITVRVAQELKVPRILLPSSIARLPLSWRRSPAVPLDSMPDEASFFSGLDLLDGLPSRRAGTIFYAIEGRTAQLVSQSRQALASYLTEKSAEQKEQAFLSALSQGRDLPLQPTIQELERFAPEWATLVPAEANLRAALAHSLGEKYRFRLKDVPALRRSLGLEAEAVEQAFERMYQQPLDLVYSPTTSVAEQIRWLLSRLAND